MTTVLLGVVIFGAAAAAMSVGVLCGRPPLRAGCRASGACALCAGPCTRHGADGEDACPPR